jgi:hypothetical protein
VHVKVLRQDYVCVNDIYNTIEFFPDALSMVSCERAPRAKDSIGFYRS